MGEGQCEKAIKFPSSLQRREVCGCPEGPAEANYCALCGRYTRYFGIRILIDPLMPANCWKMET